MNRRDESTDWASLALLHAPPAGDGYQPLGHLRVGDPGAECVREVRVDGIRLDYIEEFNDVDGWADALSPRIFNEPFPEGVRYREYADEGLRVRYVGQVRVTLGPPNHRKPDA